PRPHLCAQAFARRRLPRMLDGRVPGPNSRRETAKGEAVGDVRGFDNQSFSAKEGKDCGMIPPRRVSRMQVWPFLDAASMTYTTGELNGRTLADFEQLASKQGECWCMLYQRATPVGRGLSSDERKRKNRRDKKALVRRGRSHA